MLTRIFVLLLSIAVAGCASKSSEITASYVSPIQYEAYSCDQLSLEARRISQRASQLAGVQDEKSTSDAIATGVAIVIFWPAAFMIDGDGNTAAELSRLRGELDAIQQASILKNCQIEVVQQQEA